MTSIVHSSPLQTETEPQMRLNITQKAQNHSMMSPFRHVPDRLFGTLFRMSTLRLSHALTSERGARRWSQRELADRSGVSLATIGAIERGDDRRFNATTLGGLDAAFGWSRGHARTLMIDPEAHDTLAALPATSSADSLTVVIDGEITSVATALHGDQLSRIITMATDDGIWVLSRVSSRHTKGAALAAENELAMPVPVEGDRIHYAFHFVPKS